MWPYLADWFGNPSSGHAYGIEPQQALIRARTRSPRSSGRKPRRSSSPDPDPKADNLALRGTVLAAKTDQPHVITQVTEHPAVLETCRALERLHGIEVTYLPVDRDGLVAPVTVAAALTPRTVVVSVMAANNETGALQPIADWPASPASEARSSTATPPRRPAAGRVHDYSHAREAVEGADDVVAVGAVAVGDHLRPASAWARS